MTERMQDSQSQEQEFIRMEEEGKRKEKRKSERVPAPTHESKTFSKLFEDPPVSDWSFLTKKDLNDDDIQNMNTLYDHFDIKQECRGERNGSMMME